MYANFYLSDKDPPKNHGYGKDRRSCLLDYHGRVCLIEPETFFL